MTLKQKIEDIVNDVAWHFIGTSEATSSLIQAFREILPEKKLIIINIHTGKNVEFMKMGETYETDLDAVIFNSAIKIIEERLDE